MTHVKVRRCSECPFLRAEQGIRLGLSDDEFYCSHPIDDAEWPDVVSPREAPPKWCPLRERETIVRLGGVE
jgi:hypothetical protein